MIDIKKILVPTDLSGASAFAYTHAQEIAQRYGATVDFLHVIPVATYFSESLDKLGVPLNMDEHVYPQVKERAEHQLRNIMDNYIRDENKGHAVSLIHRKPSKAIAGYAEEHGYDLVVMAARGGHGSELFRGAVTEQVIRHASVPVITIDENFTAGNIKQILVPADASALSFACIPLALTLADIYNAEITLFHVLELYGTQSESVPLNTDDAKERSIYEAVIEELNVFLWKEGWEDISVKRTPEAFADEIEVARGEEKRTFPLKTVITRGISAHYEIERYAPEHADLIVMTTHGRSGLAHFFLGSTTEMVVRHAKVPVATLKPAKRLLEKD